MHPIRYKCKSCGESRRNNEPSRCRYCGSTFIEPIIFTDKGSAIVGLDQIYTLIEHEAIGFTKAQYEDIKRRIADRERKKKISSYV